MNSSPTPEELLHDVSRILQCCEEATLRFSKWLSHYGYYCFRRRGMNEADAEALAVTCTTDIILKLKHFHGGSVEAWVCRILHNRLVDEQRKKGLTTVPLDETFFNIPASTLSNLDAPVRSALRQAMMQLPPADRALLELCYSGAAMNWSELAKHSGLSPNNAQVRAHRAKAKLHDLLSQHPAVRDWLAS